MRIQGSTALVTGANRGIGREFTRQLLARGAAQVYGTTRRPGGIDLPGVTELVVDITDADSVADAAAAAGDVDLLVNNAGISTMTDLVTGDLEQVRAELDTHFWGTLGMTRAFAPVLARSESSAIVNVMSALSFLSSRGANAYSVGKAAEWSLTNGTRLELADQGVQVLGLFLAATDTDMMAWSDLPKNDPADVVRQALDGLEAGAWEVLADDDTRALKALLSRPPEAMYGDAVTA